MKRVVHRCSEHPVGSSAVELNLRRASVGSAEVLHVSGEIDLATIPAFHSALVRFSNEYPGATLVVDLDGVSACDDSALGVLLGAAGRLRDAGGDLVVLCTDASLTDRFVRTGFDRAVRVVATMAAAAGPIASDPADVPAR